MKTKTFFASLALAGAVAQPVSAATRSTDRSGSIVGESEELGNPIIWIIALAAIVGIIIIATTSGDEPVSP